MFMKTTARVLTVVLATAILFAAALWSWNVLAELFAAPQAEFRHLLAAALLFVAVRGLIAPASYRHHFRRHRSEHQAAGN